MKRTALEYIYGDDHVAVKFKAPRYVEPEKNPNNRNVKQCWLNITKQDIDILFDRLNSMQSSAQTLEQLQKSVAEKIVTICNQNVGLSRSLHGHESIITNNTALVTDTSTSLTIQHREIPPPPRAICNESGELST